MDAFLGSILTSIPQLGVGGGLAVVLVLLLHFYSAVLALLLVMTCIASLFREIEWPQRARFAALLLLGVVITSGQIDNLGSPLTWRLPILAVAVTLAVIGCAAFLRRGDEDEQ